MNRKIKLILGLVSLLFILSINQLQAQAPPPDGHGTTTDSDPGGSAPISGGLVYLVVLGAAYGSVKWILLPKQEEVL